MSYIAMLGSYELGNFITPGRIVWLAPLGLIIFTIYMLMIVIPQIQKKHIVSDHHKA